MFRSLDNLKLVAKQQVNVTGDSARIVRMKIKHDIASESSANEAHIGRGREQVAGRPAYLTNQASKNKLYPWNTSSCRPEILKLNFVIKLDISGWF